MDSRDSRTIAIVILHGFSDRKFDSLIKIFCHEVGIAQHIS